MSLNVAEQDSAFTDVKALSAHVCRTSNVADLVVDVAVCEHGVEVLDTLLGIPVVVVLQAFFNRAHVHRTLYDLIIVLKEEQGNTSISILARQKNN